MDPYGFSLALGATGLVVMGLRGIGFRGHGSPAAGHGTGHAGHHGADHGAHHGPPHIGQGHSTGHHAGHTPSADTHHAGPPVHHSAGHGASWVWALASPRVWFSV